MREAKPSSDSMHMPSPTGSAAAGCLSRSVKGISGARACCCEERNVMKMVVLIQKRMKGVGVK
jgi:hypothetical protein